MTPRPLRVLHALYDIAGHAGNLARFEREVGLESMAVVLRAHTLGFQADEVLCGPESGFLAQEWRRWRLLHRAVRHFDVVHFNFGRSVLPPWKGWGSAAAAGAPPAAAPLIDVYLRACWLKDLPLLHRAGIPIFVTFQGDDVRQGDYVCQQHEISHARCVPRGYYTDRSDAAKREGVRRIERYAVGLFALNPDLLDVLPLRAEFLPYANVDPVALAPRKTSGYELPVVVHAPSNREAKGTRFVLAAVDRLRAEGVRFEFVLVEGLPHEEAVRRYEGANLFVDQLLAGWYGGAAVEAMSLGVPTLAYIRDADLDHVPVAMRDDLPIIRATPDTVTDVLRTWLVDRRDALADVGVRSREFALRWHDPRAIAAKLADRYEAACRLVGPRRWRASESVKSS